MPAKEEGWGNKKKLPIFPIVVVVVIVALGAALVLSLKGGGGDGGETGEETPTAALVFTPSAPKVGGTVSFRDSSSGNPTAWLWDFGDETTSTSQNPTHSYNTAGTYTVTLTVTYANGTQKTITKPITISQELVTGTYVVFSDSGLCPDEQPPIDVWVWSGADWGLAEPALVEGKYVVSDAPEGTEVFACTSGSGSTNYVGWGIFLGADAASGHQWIAANSVDLSGHSNLEFWVKTPANLKLEVEQVPDADPAVNPTARGLKSAALRIANYGWNNAEPDTWQKISIPISAFRNVDMTRLRCPFMITMDGGDSRTFYIDDVVWIP